MPMHVVPSATLPMGKHVPAEHRLKVVGVSQRSPFDGSPACAGDAAAKPIAPLTQLVPAATGPMDVHAPDASQSEKADGDSHTSVAPPVAGIVDVDVDAADEEVLDAAGTDMRIVVGVAIACV